MSAPASPTFVNRNENFAELATIRKSAASASTAPAPAATPLTAATIGIGVSRIALTTAPLMRVNSSSSRTHRLELADDLLDVAARAEPAALAGEDEDADVAAVRQLAEQVAEIGVDVERERVQLVRARERDRRDAVVEREVEVLPVAR